MKKYITIIRDFLTKNTSSKQTVIKNTFWLLLAEGVSKGSVFILSILFARYLGPEDFGKYSYIVSIVSVFSVFADFGLSTIMLRELSRNGKDAEKYLVNWTLLKLTLSILVVLLILIVVFLINGSLDFLIYWLLYSVYSTIFNLWEFIRSYYRSSEKMENEALLKILTWLISISIILLFYHFYWSLYSIFMGFCVSGIVTTLISMCFVYYKIWGFKLRNHIDLKFINSLLWSWFYLLWWLFFIQIFVNIDQVLMWYFWLSNELWIYSAMYRIIFIFSAASQVFVNALVPNLLKKYSFKKIKVSSWIILFSSLILLLLGFLLWESFIILLYWEKYKSGYMILMIQLLTFVIISLDHLYYLLLNSLGFEKKVFYFSIISWIINLWLNILLIPRFFWVWAALATLSSEFILLLLLLYNYLPILKNYKTSNSV